MKTWQPTIPPGTPLVIRRGQRVPYRKASHREIDERRGCVARLLARGVRKMSIHRLIKQKFNRQWRTTDRDIAFVTGLVESKWLTRARARICENSGSEAFTNLTIIYGGDEAP